MTHDLSYPIAETLPYIHWLYFFHAWGFPPQFASVVHIHDCASCRQQWIASFSPKDQSERATEALRRYDDAREQIAEWAEAGLTTHFRVALQEAASDGDDIVLTESGLRLPMLRQQHTIPNKPCLCLADFIRPISQGIPDRIGLYASTVDPRMEAWAESDDYRHLLAQTLADRLAEATAELGHQTVRRQLWGYAPDEHLTPEELFQERYQGRRPAVGYPSMPDQSIIFLLDRVLHLATMGITLTEHGAMRPHASTCGLMLAHPATCHFSVGRISEEQLQDYAQRRGEAVEWIRRFIIK